MKYIRNILTGLVIFVAGAEVGGIAMFAFYKAVFNNVTETLEMNYKPKRRNSRVSYHSYHD